MKIFFMRHGETDYNKKMIMQGALDTELNDIGKSQAKIASEEVSKLNIDIIICSPQKRALETAKIIAKKINKEVEVIVDERLRERSFGELEGVKIEDLLKENPLFLKKISTDDECFIEGVESLEEVKSRIDSVLKFIKNNYDNNRILIISHGAVLRILGNLIDVNEQENFVKLDNCQIVSYEL